MAGRIAGVTYVRVDGSTLTLGGSCTVSPSSVEREGQTGLSGHAGYIERPRTPFIEVELRTTADLSLEDLEDITGAVVQAELANGRIYVLRNAYSVPPFEVNAADGTVTVRFEGSDCKEQ